MRIGPALLAAALALAGCLAPAPDATCLTATAPKPQVLLHGGAQADPRQPVDFLVAASGGNSAHPIALEAGATDGQSAVFGEGHPLATNLTVWGDGAARLGRLRFDPPQASPVVTVQSERQGEPGCEASAAWLVSQEAVRVLEGDLAQAGKGVHVRYAGFWENGTLFETNMPAFDQSAWPRAGWYESAPYDALPVYVYNQSRSEEPPTWKPLARAAATGTPVDGPVAPIAAGLDNAAGIGYYTTIKGFNDGLKGLSTTGARVMWIAAADAYPAGTANNPLAGANLVFYVELDDVVSQPCPAGVPAMACP